MVRLFRFMVLQSSRKERAALCRVPVTGRTLVPCLLYTSVYNLVQPVPVKLHVLFENVVVDIVPVSYTHLNSLIKSRKNMNTMLLSCIFCIG